MADLLETTAAVDGNNDWIGGVYQLEEEDQVLGGADGIDNLQAKQLMARINYVKTGLLGLNVSAFIRTLLDDIDAATALATLGAVTQADIDAAIANLVASSPAALDTLNELAAALGNDPNFAATITNTLALKAPLASPVLTGNPTAPTAAPGTNNTQLSNTAFVVAAILALFGQNNTWSKAQRGAVVALVDGATITPDFSLGNNYDVTLAGNRTLANPTNLVAGQSGVIKVAQDATGGRTLAFGSYWKFAAGGVPSLTGTASAVDLIAYHVESAARIAAVFHGDMQ